ncbi:MAG TPA: thioredoxin-dependent thiol peroxidase [Chitinophagales bacterium]|nr:thioredoxin-dependent thiol peroxidase [Chitinophagales bacterium]
MLELKEGDKAPEIKAKDQDGNPISLKQFRGKKVILFFYPEDDTPVCTVEACNFRDNFALLRKKGYEIIGVSPNSAVEHKKFIGKFKLPYTLIADEDKKVINDYGVWGLKKLYGREYMGLHRTTFVIDENGKIEKIVRRVLSKIATEQVLKPVK